MVLLQYIFHGTCLGLPATEFTIPMPRNHTGCSSVIDGGFVDQAEAASVKRVQKVPVGL